MEVVGHHSPSPFLLKKYGGGHHTRSLSLPLSFFGRGREVATSPSLNEEVRIMEVVTTLRLPTPLEKENGGVHQ